MGNENEYAAAVTEMAFQVHRATGPGLLESAYQRMLAFELEQAKMVFEKEISVPIKFKSNFLQSLNAASVNSLPLESSVPMLKMPTRGFFRPSTSRE